MANRFPFPFSAPFSVPLLVGVLALLSPSPPGPGFAEDQKARRIGFILEGDFESPEIARAPEGARRTLLVPFYEWEYGVRPFTREKWDDAEMNWEDFSKIARSVADGIVGELEPRLVRDHRGVIEYAIVASKDPFLTSVLLSGEFPKLFRETLGDRLQVILLDRHLVYVFPAASGALADFGPALVDEFRSTRLPVSLEIFLVDEIGARVVGEISREKGSE